MKVSTVFLAAAAHAQILDDEECYSGRIRVDCETFLPFPAPAGDSPLPIFFAIFRNRANSQCEFGVLLDVLRQEYSRATDSHHLVGLDSGDMLMFGGVIREDQEDTYLSDIWRLSNNKWSLDGFLNKPVSFGSAIKIGRSIFMFSGKGDYELAEFKIEKVTLNEKEELECVHLINKNVASFLFPILYHTENNRCVADL